MNHCFEIKLHLRLDFSRFLELRKEDMFYLDGVVFLSLDRE